MGKVFKSPHINARMLASYEREVLEEVLPHDPEADGNAPVTPEMILAKARAQAAQKVEEAYAEGLQRGTEASTERFAQAVAGSAEALGAAAQALQEAREAFLASLEPQVIELVGLIAGAVIEREARTDPELLRVTVRRALETLLDRERVVVHLHPADLEAMRAQKVTLLEEFDGVQRLDLEADESVPPGGCVIESELMHVDARLETQLERILDALREVPGAATDTPPEELDHREE